MLIDQSGNITIITHERASIPEIVLRITKSYKKFKNNNIIVNLSSLGWIKLEEIIEFLQISNTHRASKQSFVIVSNKIDYDYVPDELVVVPSLQEAYDIIEMEEIERDLGF
ncbi:MAG: ribonuclease Z [Flavobacteriaceae bacterium]|nr:ribonuclease Z [Bacteroidia bacterium]MBT8286910.1 ribonuclease Z [Bacteroidia bacterium]NNF73850.1 ribonuclease Z [Flavobacteriaceae bacterium]NNK74366.1 ribonuclease Z [Flavobacteriaceae bacterium]